MTASFTLRLDNTVKQRMRQAARNGLRKGAEHVLEVSLRRVPIEEGTLARSGTVTVDSAGLEAIVSFDTPYAVRQHEDLTMRHDDGRTAKFLENPMHEQADVVRDVISREIRSQL